MNILFKKIFLAIVCCLSIIFLSGCAMSDNQNTSDLELQTLFSSKPTEGNRAWIGTFQLVFNDIKNELFKKDIIFEGEKPTFDLIGLNKEEFNKDMLNDNSYYKSFGKTSPRAKEKIKKDIKKKFNETSDLIDSLDWAEGEGRYYSYAMLKKVFEFLKEFDKLEDSNFNNSEKLYKYFGIKDSSDKKLYDNVTVMFYDNPNSYAVKLNTKNNDIVYLYRTDDNKSFDKMYKDMNEKSEKYEGNYDFTSKDSLKIPNISIDTRREYKELCNKYIEGTEQYFSSAIETLQFELDSKGGKVKSEAIIMVKMNSIPQKEERRDFIFDKPFTMFLIDKDKKDPYMALRVVDLENLQK